MFEKELLVEQDFKKNKIFCLFAAADTEFTIGFAETGRPKSFMRKNQLDQTKRKPVELVMRKKREESIFLERIVGDDEFFNKYKVDISGYISQK